MPVPASVPILGGHTPAVYVTGAPKIIAALRRYGALAPQAAGVALVREAEHIVRLAKTKIPVKTGNARDSGFVLPPDVSPTQAEVVLGFGGPAGTGNVGASNKLNASYAIPLHEHLGVMHKNGQAKFLEAAVLEAAPTAVARMRATLGLLWRVSGGTP